MTPLVSVVIPNHNYGHYLASAIDSVLAQTYPRVEIIVVDDGSTDGSEDVLRAYGARIRWIRQQRGGVSSARNRGIEEGAGELIALLDADDLWHPEKLDKQVVLLADPAVGMVYTGLAYIDGDGRVVGTSAPRWRGRILKDFMMSLGMTVSGSSPLIRRSCFEAVGLFDPALSTSADWDMWRRIACHYEVQLAAEALTFYRLHGSSMHLNVPLIERDMSLALEKAFADPAASEIAGLRRRCFGRLNLVLSGAYLDAGQTAKSIAHAARGFWYWPPTALYVAAYPMRKLQRWLSPRNDGSRLLSWTSGRT
jgi:glycosyltransferase involved in cell wall biosynthesis